LRGLAEEDTELSLVGHVPIATVRDSYGIEYHYEMRCWSETEIKLDILRKMSQREVTAEIF
jgi:hypothetical protein